MRGKAFQCYVCHELTAVQDGGVVEYLNGYFMKPLDEGLPPGAQVFQRPDPRYIHQLNNGAFAFISAMMMCQNCIPEGVDFVPLADLWVKPPAPEPVVGQPAEAANPSRWHWR